MVFVQGSFGTVYLVQQKDDPSQCGNPRFLTVVGWWWVEMEDIDIEMFFLIILWDVYGWCVWYSLWMEGIGNRWTCDEWTYITFKYSLASLSQYMRLPKGCAYASLYMLMLFASDGRVLGTRTAWLTSFSLQVNFKWMVNRHHFCWNLMLLANGWNLCYKNWWDRVLKIPYLIYNSMIHEGWSVM